MAAFVKKLQELGWIVGRNIQIDQRWPELDPNRAGAYAAELAALSKQTCT